MNCQECREWLDDLLLRDPAEAPPADVAEHLAACGECAKAHAAALQTLDLLTPHCRVTASARFKERILSSIPSEFADNHRPAPVAEAATPTATRASYRPAYGEDVISGRRVERRWRAALMFALAAVVLLAVSVFRSSPEREPSSGRAWNLLAEASAAEAALFADGQLTSLANEIVVEPVKDPELIAMRWLPLMAIGADGKPQFQQLKLGGETGKGYTVQDQTWYEPSTRRFGRALSLDGRPLFANAYDGKAVYLLEFDEQGQPRLKRSLVTGEFQPPKNPAMVLGIAVGLTSNLDRRRAKDFAIDAGATTLDDGARAHVVKLSFSRPKADERADADKQLDAYFRVTIRDDDKTIESFEYIVREQLLFTVRRGKPAEDREPPFGWDLSGLEKTLASAKGRSPVQALADLVVPNISVDDLVKRADYPVYLFAMDPAWANDRRIMDILDLVSPPHRMFAVTYRAKDKRHVVLVQAQTFNEKFGPAARAGKLVYTSPNGIKVYSGPRDRWLSEILLSSARAMLIDPPADDRTGYLLETPEGTFPALAVNGPLSDDELHALIDSLQTANK